MDIIDTLSKNKINKSNSIAVYTAVTDSYDNVKTPQFINKNIDYYLFKDDSIDTDKLWNFNKINFKYRDPRRLAKLFKVFPHILFPNYDYSIWIDANFKILGDLRPLIRSYMQNNYIAFIRHPKRSCIYEESKYVISLGYDNMNAINKQIALYSNNGYPSNNGLISGGFIMRKHNDKKCIKLMKKWWREIDTYSSRDQLSFNYVCWKNNYDYICININQSKNKFFEIKSHPAIKFYDNNGSRIINIKTIKAIILHFISTKKIYKKYMRKYYLKIKYYLKLTYNRT